MRISKAQKRMLEEAAELMRLEAVRKAVGA